MNFENIFNLDPNVWPLFLMVFLRIATVFSFLPFFGDGVIPVRIRVLLSLLFAFCMWPVIQKSVQANGLLQWNSVTLVWITMREVFFGFCVGFAAKVLLSGAKLAAEISGLNMGFHTATLFSPLTNTHESAFSAFKYWIAVTVLITLNAHYVFIEGLMNSFVLVPLGGVPSSSAMTRIAINTVATSFTLGLRIAAPLIIIQFISNISLGLLNRIIPQLNVFVVSFPLSFILSIAVLFLSMAVLVKFLGGHGFAVQTQFYQSMQHSFENNLR